MNLSDFEKCYHKIWEFHSDLIDINHIIWVNKLSINQVDLLLSVIKIVLSRLCAVKTRLEERKCNLNAKKDEQTLF